MKEYGGYLPLELNAGKEYYDTMLPLRLNTGRAAITAAVLASGCRRAKLPVYLCGSVREMLDTYKIPYSLYNIGPDFLPMDADAAEDEIIIIVNYFGLLQRCQMENASLRYKHLIFDNTQAFYSEPFPDAYNVYSCRKFFGVPDGAYLIGKGIPEEGPLPLPSDISSQRSLFLLKSIEEGTNGAYSDSLENETAIGNSGIKKMSALTRRIMQSVNYEEVCRKRNANFHTLQQELGGINELELETCKLNGPMIYPLLLRLDGLREYLIQKKVYVPQWWRFVLDIKEANPYERLLSQYLLPLPLDQRYDKYDMQIIAGYVKEYIEHKGVNNFGY